MIIQCMITAISRNSDGTFRITLTAIADPNQQFQATLPATEAQNAYIGRAATVTLAYA